MSNGCIRPGLSEISVIFKRFSVFPSQVSGAVFTGIAHFTSSDVLLIQHFVDTIAEFL